MSLIEQALRQIQRPTSPSPSPQALPQPQAPRTSETSQAPSHAPASANPLGMFVTAWVGIAVLVAGLVGGALWTHRLMVSAQRDVRPVPGIEPPATRLAQVPALEIPDIMTSAQSPQSGPGFQLNGIVEGVGEPFAIINGHITRLGETIGGAILLTVDEGSATLRLEDNEELVLRTTQ